MATATAAIIMVTSLAIPTAVSTESKEKKCVQSHNLNHNCPESCPAFRIFRSVTAVFLELFMQFLRSLEEQENTSGYKDNIAHGKIFPQQGKQRFRRPTSQA